MGARYRSFEDAPDEIWRIYNNSIKEFENKDDTYSYKAVLYYDRWRTLGDRIGDLGNVLGSAGLLKTAKVRNGESDTRRAGQTLDRQSDEFIEHLDEMAELSDDVMRGGTEAIIFDVDEIRLQLRKESDTVFF